VVGQAELGEDVAEGVLTVGTDIGTQNHSHSLRRSRRQNIHCESDLRLRIYDLPSGGDTRVGRCSGRAQRRILDGSTFDGETRGKKGEKSERKK